MSGLRCSQIAVSVVGLVIDLPALDLFAVGKASQTAKLKPPPANFCTGMVVWEMTFGSSLCWASRCIYSRLFCS